MKILNKKAVSVIEYSLLFIIVLGGFIVMKSYIQRGLFATWARSGQSFAYGRQYDPQKTVDCAYDDISNRWFDRNCLASKSQTKGCNGDLSCEENIITGMSCSASKCNDLNNAETL